MIKRDRKAYRINVIVKGMVKAPKAPSPTPISTDALATTVLIIAPGTVLAKGEPFLLLLHPWKHVVNTGQLMPVSTQHSSMHVCSQYPAGNC